MGVGIFEAKAICPSTFLMTCASSCWAAAAFGAPAGIDQTLFEYPASFHVMFIGKPFSDSAVKARLAHRMPMSHEPFSNDSMDCAPLVHQVMSSLISSSLP